MLKTLSAALLVASIFTAPVLARLAREKGIDMPIAEAVDTLIAGRATVDEVLGALLSRPPKSESI